MEDCCAATMKDCCAAPMPDVIIVDETRAQDLCKWCCGGTVLCVSNLVIKFTTAPKFGNYKCTVQGTRAVLAELFSFGEPTGYTMVGTVVTRAMTALDYAGVQADAGPVHVQPEKRKDTTRKPPSKPAPRVIVEKYPPAPPVIVEQYPLNAAQLEYIEKCRQEYELARQRDMARPKRVFMDSDNSYTKEQLEENYESWRKAPSSIINQSLTEFPKIHCRFAQSWWGRQSDAFQELYQSQISPYEWSSWKTSKRTKYASFIDEPWRTEFVKYMNGLIEGKKNAQLKREYEENLADRTKRAKKNGA